MKFYNREKEMQFLRQHFESEPNSILIVYGPKSSGKTTLMEQVLHQLDTKIHPVSYINLRGVLVNDFNSFLNVFFPKNLKRKVFDILEGFSLNFGFFSIDDTEEPFVKENAFLIMEEKLEQTRKRGLLPILVIDEIQMLKSIYMNGERRLLDDLFNLFVRLTKERHLAHVVLASSDSFYINEIHQSAGLEKTTEYLLVDHLDKQVVMAWLQAESIPVEQAEEVYRWLGGSPWELAQFVRKWNRTDSVGSAIRELFLQKQIGNLKHYRNYLLRDDKLRKLFDRIIKAIVLHGKAQVEDYKDDDLHLILPEMIEKDVWFFRVDKQEITANSLSYWWAMKEITEGI